MYLLYLKNWDTLNLDLIYLLRRTIEDATKPRGAGETPCNAREITLVYNKIVIFTKYNEHILQNPT